MIYVLSDIHGNERRFNSVMKQIDLRSEDTLYVLGDVIDRHPGGIRILRKIMSMLKSPPKDNTTSDSFGTIIAQLCEVSKQNSTLH